MYVYYVIEIRSSFNNIKNLSSSIHTTDSIRNEFVPDNPQAYFKIGESFYSSRKTEVTSK